MQCFRPDVEFEIRGVIRAPFYYYSAFQMGLSFLQPFSESSLNTRSDRHDGLVKANEALFFNFVQRYNNGEIDRTSPIIKRGLMNLRFHQALAFQSKIDDYRVIGKPLRQERFA